MAIFDTMQLITSPIAVVVTGMAASMGSICFAERPKADAYFILTQGYSFTNLSSQEEWRRLLILIFRHRKWKNSGGIKRYFAKTSGQPLDKIQQDTDRDFYLMQKKPSSTDCMMKLLKGSNLNYLFQIHALNCI